MFLNSENFEAVVLKPNFSKDDGFFPLGDLVIPLEDLEQLGLREEFQNSNRTTGITTISSTTSVSSNTLFPIIKSRQGFTTNLYAGAVDRPTDYELIWDNKGSVDSYQGQEISIWKPICNQGFMDVGCVFNKGYSKEMDRYDPSSPYSASKGSVDLIASAFNKTYKTMIIPATRCAICNKTNMYR